jgi:chemotaxis signal transduction protein
MEVALRGEHDSLRHVIAGAQYLVCRAARRLCAVPLSSVVEVMRPLPFERFASVPGFVSGVALVRGHSVPVVDLGYLLTTEGDAPPPAPERFVCLRHGTRLIVLAVEAVLGVRGIESEELRALPPLLQASRHLQALLHLDRELCSVLDAARVFELAPALGPPTPPTRAGGPEALE